MLLPATEISPAAEAVLTTWQASPCFNMRGTNARMPCATPMRFTPNTHCHSSAVVVHAGPQTATPAPLHALGALLSLLAAAALLRADRAWRAGDRS